MTQTDEHEMMVKAEKDFKDAINGLDSLVDTIDADVRRIATKAYYAGIFTGIGIAAAVALIWGVLA